MKRDAAAGQGAVTAQAAVKRLCASGLAPVELLRQVADRVQAVVPNVASGWQLTDPATQLVTGGFMENVPPGAMPELIENEVIGGDFVTFNSLSNSRVAVATLNAVTRGEQERSRRYRIHAKIGWTDEVRAVLRSGGSTWGQICMARGDGEPAFSSGEVDFLTSVAGAVGVGLRSGMLLGYATSSKPCSRAPGLVVLQDDGSVDSVSDQALEWLSELGHEVEEFPPVIYEVARRARLLADTDDTGPPARARLRLPSQQWLVVHGARLRSPSQGHASTAVILEPASHTDMAPLILQACELTPRERQIVEMLLRGVPVPEMATTLWISPYTVRDHIKAIYGKLGVRSRPEMTAKLFHEHYGTTGRRTNLTTSP
jgi:DNA-binding CsgD family transcriptional regulator